MSKRLRLTGNYDEHGRLVSVTFSNRRGGACSVPVQSVEPGSGNERSAEQPTERLTFREWAERTERDEP